MAAPNQVFSKDEIKDALITASGNIVKAAEIAGCDRKTVYNMIERYKTLKRVVDEQRRIKKQIRVELAECNLDKDLEAGEWSATRFVLSTLGKEEGYSTRSEVAGVPGQPTEVILKTAEEWAKQKRKQAEQAGVVLTR